MKNVKSILSVLILFLAVSFTSCKKSNTTPAPTPTPAPAPTPSKYDTSNIYLATFESSAIPNTYPVSAFFYMRTKSGTELIDSTNFNFYWHSVTSNFANTYICGLPLGSCNYAPLKTLRGSTNVLEVCYRYNSQITVVASFTMDAQHGYVSCSPSTVAKINGNCSERCGVIL